ncbi:XdhC family protein [Thiohalorhabdus sp.]|uniref:XdhC family protein n=1 Tax=Thiohalorhabdus sp. TaxID=3094134 RepID=UPI002FC3D71F
MSPFETYADGTDPAVIAEAKAWLDAGYGLHLVTVVSTWGSSPRPPGSLLARRDDGATVGSVSGGCVEEALPDCLPEWGGTPARLVFGGESGESGRYRLPCGGTLELMAEPLLPGDERGVGAVYQALSRGETLRRRVDRATGWVRLGTDEGGPDLAADGEAVVKRFGPSWRLLVVGGGELGHHLAAMARRLDYRVTVCEPRGDYRAGFAEPCVELDTRMPDDAVAAWGPDPRGAVVATCHDPKLDDLALLEALDSAAFYVGALGSAQTNHRRRQRLIELGLSGQTVARLRGPVGLAIGSRTPAEIAVSVLAEMTAVRHDRDPRPEGMAGASHAHLTQP